MNSTFRLTSLAALTAAALLALGAATANPRGGSMFDKVDADKDGNITRAEADAFHAEKLAGLDANSDGQVTFEEAKAHRERQREEHARARFARHDKDGDGRVSVEEFGARGDRMFERMDKDSDGVVTQEEAKAAHHGHRRGKHGGHDGHDSHGE